MIIKYKSYRVVSFFSKDGVFVQTIEPALYGEYSECAWYISKIYYESTASGNYFTVYYWSDVEHTYYLCGEFDRLREAVDFSISKREKDLFNMVLL